MDLRLFSDISPHALREAKALHSAAKRLGVVIGVAALAACQSTTASSFQCAVAPGDLASMPEPDVISISRRTSGCELQPEVVIRRVESPSLFDQYVVLAGGLDVGDSKTLLVVDGHVMMNEDRSLTFVRVGIGPEVPPQITTILPGAPRYEEILARVGSMSPGERRVVLLAPRE